MKNSGRVFTYTNGYGSYMSNLYSSPSFRFYFFFPDPLVLSSLSLIFRLGELTVSKYVICLRQSTRCCL